MKFLSLIIGLMFTMHVSAQEVNKTEDNKPTRTVEQLESLIQSIQKKMEYVQSVPEQDQKAKEQGWYDEMNERLDTLTAERDKLIRVQSKKQFVTKEEWSNMSKEKQEDILAHPELYTIEK